MAGAEAGRDIEEDIVATKGSTLTVRVAGGFADNFGSCALTNVDQNCRGRGRGY